MANNYIPNLFKRNKEIVKEFLDQKLFNNPMQVPKLEKIIINVGLGKATGNQKLIDNIARDISLISGQKPIITKAKKSEAGFKIRQGQPIGAKVTLRKYRMFDFLERLISLALPRVRDFEGLSKKSFDGRGNYTFGIKEHLIFQEIDYDKVEDIIGADITIVTTAKTNEDAEKLLRALGLPLKK